MEAARTTERGRVARPWLTPSETAVLLQVRSPSVGSLVSSGLLRDVSTDRHRRIDPEGVLALVAAPVEGGSARSRYSWRSAS
jgi:hypothetical protein